jgi:hypothetical protein
MKKKLSSFYGVILLVFLLLPSFSSVKAVGVRVDIPCTTTNIGGVISITGGTDCNTVDGYNAYKPAGMPDGSIYNIIVRLLSWLLGLFALFGIIGFLLSGIFYLISAGDDDMIKKAKKTMVNSIIGVIVGLSGYLIVQAVSTMLGGRSATF